MSMTLEEWVEANGEFYHWISPSGTVECKTCHALIAANPPAMMGHKEWHQENKS